MIYSTLFLTKEANKMKPLESYVKYRPEIDGLRSIAIISVLFFHLGYQTFSGGFVGVDVFFVISGFLITNLIKREIETTGKFSVKQFYARRIRRLLPALFVMLFFTILFAILVFSPTHLSRIGGAMTSAIASVSNIYFWLETDYFDVSAKLKPFLHTWSLSVEEQFYFIWPALLWILMKAKKGWLPPLFLIFAGIVSLYLNQVFGDGEVGFISRHFPKAAELIKDGNATIFFLLPFRIFEFAIGALIVWLIHIKSKQWVYDVFFIIGIMLIMYAIFTFDDKMLFPSYYGLVPTVGAGLVIYAGHHTRAKLLLSNRLAVGIGLISYSLYLTHWPIIVFWTYLTGTINFQDSLFIIAIATILAFVSYKYIEQPFRKKKYDLATSQWKYSAIAAVALLAYLGVNIKQNDGWPWRVAKTVVFEEMGNAKDYHRKMWGGAGYMGFIDTNNTKADIVLIGDSHAHHYAEGLYKVIAKDNNISLYVSKCFSSIYLPGFIRTDKKSYIKTSSESLEKELPYIKNGNDPLVILSESWLYQLERADLIDSRGKRLHKNITIQYIINGILRLKEQIGDSTLVVIGDVPGAKYNLYDIFSRPRPLFFADFDPQKYLKVPGSVATAKFNQKLKEAAQKTGKFVFLDPYDVLCKNSLCRNVDDKGRLIYSDTYHLSKYGSIVVIKGFSQQLKKLLKKKITEERKKK
jgi:peptidoglycan/LPS O-acetylase OafA/YrhL